MNKANKSLIVLTIVIFGVGFLSSYFKDDQNDTPFDVEFTTLDQLKEIGFSEIDLRDLYINDGLVKIYGDTCIVHFDFLSNNSKRIYFRIMKGKTHDILLKELALLDNVKVDTAKKRVYYYKIAGYDSTTYLYYTESEKLLMLGELN